ncbi:peroxide stress protein YaaA [Finegoldia magna]|uniref:peroxide stress protein YaaA n=1 Tax=Finegoldia magna TaxID=1260 RepID=UPI0032BF30E5
MKIIISPAKTFKIRKIKNKNCDCLYESKKNELVSIIKEKSIEELKKLWKCSDKIAEESYKLYENFDSAPKGCAILSFDGIQYQYMDVDSLDEKQLEYLEEHLRILSGLYGILRPLDEISKYRLDFEDKLINLYEFWEDEIRNHFKGEEIIDLASKEYGQNIYKYLDKTPVKIDFKEEVLVDGEIKLKTKATPSKILRGRMVNYMAKNNVENIEQLKKFSCDGYNYSEDYSDINKLVFVKTKESD